jgi:hypothetical protein
MKAVFFLPVMTLGSHGMRYETFKESETRESGRIAE